MPFFKKLVVEWKRNSIEMSELVWRIPNEAFPKINDVKKVIVKEHERAVLLESGIIKNFLTPGKYQISKDVSEIIWVDISPKTCPFGLRKDSGLITADGKKIGLSGVITLKVKGDEGSVRLFINKVLAGMKTLFVEQLVDWLRQGILVSVLHDIIVKSTSKEFVQINREKLNDLILSKLSNELPKYGIEVSSINITGYVVDSNNS